MLDRSLAIYKVAGVIDEARGGGKLVEFQNNATPSRSIFVDPDHVVAITHDGHNY